MKKILTSLFVVLLLVSCKMDDPYEGEPIRGVTEPTFDLSTEWGKCQNDIYTRYGIEVMEKIDTSLYVYDLTSIKNIVKGETVGHHISQADPTQLVAAIHFLENEIFAKLGEDFVKKYLPRNIMFLNMCGYYTNSGLLEGMQPGVRMYPGYGELGVGGIALAGISADFTQLKQDTKLQRGWISLILEKAFERLPFPTQFAALFDKGSQLDDYSTIELGSLHDYGFICNNRKSEYLEGVHEPTNYILKLSLEQDISDFVAAVLVLPESELNALKGINPIIASKIEAARIYKNQIINSIKK